MACRSVVLLALTAVTTPIVADDEPAFELRDGDRVVFLGNTLFERMQRYGFVEAALTARFPERDVTFRNLGWSGDTVWAESRGLFDAPEKGYERLVAHVGELKPTVILLAYGNNEAFAGEEGLPAFTRQYEKLLDDLTKASAEGVRFALVGPLPMEDLGTPAVDVAAYNANVSAYGETVRDLCERRGHRFVDLGSYVAAVNAMRASGGEPRPLTDDGLHFNEFGYRQFATALTFHLGLHGGDDLVLVSFDRSKALSHAHGCRLEKVEPTAHGVRFELTADRLAPDWLIAVEGAADDMLALRSGDETFAAKWGLPGEGTFSLPVHPDARQYEALRRAIVEKNRLYFLRWRPQNVTYLTLFRKHEQGRFAADAEAYDLLVAEQEREIAKLRVPVTRTYELVRVDPTDR